MTARHPRTAALLLALTGLLAAEPAAARGPGKNDSLPAGAVARLGAARFWAGSLVEAVAWSPDGKTLATGDRSRMVRLWDAATGREIRRLGPHPEDVQAVAFSPDGKLLASRCGDLWAMRFSDNSIRLWEVSTGKELRRFGGFPCPPRQVGRLYEPAHWAFRVCFSPDGKTLAAAGGHIDRCDTVRLWDVATGKELRAVKASDQPVHCFAFSPNGKVLATGSKDANIRLRDTSTGREIRHWKAHGEGVLDVAFSPDGKTLASGGMDDAFRLWDAATGREVRHFPEKPAMYLFFPRHVAVAFTPDGRMLAWKENDKRATVHLTEVKTGKEVLHFEATRSADCLRFSPDGKTVAANGGSYAHLWDVASGRALSPPPEGANLDSVEVVAFAAGGARLVSAADDGVVRVWDTGTGAELRRFGTHADPIFRKKFGASPDGRMVADYDSTGGQAVRVRDTATGKELRRLPLPKLPTGQSWSWGDLVFVEEGKSLAVAWSTFKAGRREGQIDLWDLSTGRKVRSLEAPGRAPFHHATAGPGGRSLASLDGRGTVRLWDVATGEELGRAPAFKEVGSKSQLALAADGRTAAAFNPFTIWVGDLRTGKQRFRLKGRGVKALSFSPDGRTLAVAGEDGTIDLWEVASGKQRGRFTGHKGPVNTLTFAPRGRLLASGGEDTQIYLWDLTGQAGGRPAAPLTAEELKRRWAELAGEDAEAAYRAIRALSAAPGEAVPFLGRQLRPVPPADGRRVARLLADLDAEDFAVREAATRELERLGPAVEADLRKALQGDPSAEVRDRAGGLLRKLEASASGPEALRTVRAVEVLEQAGTPEARRVLNTLAKGAPGARLTQEAKAALERMDGPASGH